MATAPSPSLLNGLAPVLNRDTRILILGSFPGNASLKAEQYYAHPRNQFWPLLSKMLDEELVALPYTLRLQRLQARGIGLWDVIAACAREGSLDSAIRQAQANDFDLLKHQCPQLATVCFNGKASGKFAPLFAEAGFKTLVLPSSSPAHMRMTFSEKLVVWRGILD